MSDTLALEKDYKRTGTILSKKMNALLLPSILTSAASSLNEFVDSILMSNLLGSTALAIINYCFCIMMIYAMVQILIGYGGMIVYSKYAGVKETDKAQEIFSASFWLIVLTSFLVMIAGLVFKDNIAALLCNDQSLLPQLKLYLYPLILSAPLVIIINGLSYFLPVFGMPNLSMVIIIIANGVNLAMDYIYVHFFHFGVEGAAWATFTGYVAAAIFIVILILTRKCKLTLSFMLFSDMKDLGDVLVAGLPQALFQVCFAVQNVYFNHITESLGGESALITFSLQLQMQSIISVILSGIVDTMAEFVAIVHAQQDNIGIRYLMSRSILFLCVFTLTFFALIQIWPQCILLLYGVTEPEIASVALPAIRLFATAYVFRSITILLRTYLNACGYDYYAMGISIWDSLIGLFLWANILIAIFGINGLWIAYPLNAVSLMAAIIVINYIYSKRHENCSGILMIRNDPNIIAQKNITIEDKNATISDVSERIQTFCHENNIADNKGLAAGLLTEEMCLFAASNNAETLFIDIMLRIYKDNIQIDFRNLGVPANPLYAKEGSNAENIKILNNMPSKIEYDYSLGMNSTKITIAI